MMKKLVVCSFLIILAAASMAQTRYWVFFTDKKGTSFDPAAYFDPEAITRLNKTGISLYDSSCFPVNEHYLSAVATLSDSVTSILRWFNAAGITTDAERASKISELPFVRVVEPMSVFSSPLCGLPEAAFDTSLNSWDRPLLEKQTAIMGGGEFRKAGINGKGVRVAVLDAGFPSVNSSPAFEHIRNEGRIIKTFDFVKKKEFVYSYNTHGTMVLSCIAGIINGIPSGLATGAEFLLARTEVATEPYSEEEHWLEAMEWADRNGASIINSSLGYTYHRYFNNEMDGKTSLVARAGNMAARRGILVVNAAGNEGDSKWKYIGTPADADSVLSIGGVSPYTLYHIDFSSFGPTSDGRLKPNVCASGMGIVSGKEKWQLNYGTSFASPFVAGFAACASQTKPELTAMQLFREIEKSGHLWPYFDYAHGYGIPMAGYFLGNKSAADTSLDLVVRNDSLIIIVRNVREADTVWDADPLQELLYYNIQEEGGRLLKYAVISVYQHEVLGLPLSEIAFPKKININYRRYSTSWQNTK